MAVGQLMNPLRNGLVLQVVGNKNPWPVPDYSAAQLLINSSPMYGGAFTSNEIKAIYKHLENLGLLKLGYRYKGAAIEYFDLKEEYQTDTVFLASLTSKGVEYLNNFGEPLAAVARG